MYPMCPIKKIFVHDTCLGNDFHAEFVNSTMQVEHLDAISSISRERTLRWSVSSCIAVVNSWMIAASTMHLMLSGKKVYQGRTQLQATRIYWISCFHRLICLLIWQQVCGGPMYHQKNHEFETWNGCLRVNPEFLTLTLLWLLINCSCRVWTLSNIVFIDWSSANVGIRFHAVQDQITAGRPSFRTCDMCSCSLYQWCRQYNDSYSSTLYSGMFKLRLNSATKDSSTTRVEA